MFLNSSFIFLPSSLRSVSGGASGAYPEERGQSGGRRPGGTLLDKCGFDLCLVDYMYWCSEFLHGDSCACFILADD